MINITTATCVPHRNTSERLQLYPRALTVRDAVPGTFFMPTLEDARHQPFPQLTLEIPIKSRTSVF